MNVCDECGMSLISGGVHSPYCSNNPLSEDEKESMKTKVSEDNIVSTIYQVVIERTKKLLTTQIRGTLLQLSNLSEDTSNDSTHEMLVRIAVEAEVEKILQDPLIESTSMAGSMVTLQVLLEQGYLNHEKLAKDIEGKWD